MPIKADYTWTEKKDTVKVVIPLKGVSANKVDVLVSVSSLKVNFSPYILDIFLCQEVDSVKHKATVKDGVLTVTLCKKEPGVWGKLELEGDKSQIKAAKEEASVQQAAVNEALSQQRQERKLAEEKHSLRKQMKLEETERARLENLKQEEKETAEKEVYEALSQLHMKESTKPGSKPAAQKSSSGAEQKHVSFEPAKEEHDETNIDALLNADDIDDGVVDGKKKALLATVEDFAHYDFPDPDEEEGDHHSARAMETNDYVAPEEEDEDVRYVPPPRSMGLSANADQKIGITFTPRVFPTPMRESKAAEEEDWVAKNRRHLKNHGVLGKNQVMDVSEEDPVWLKAKGDDFLRAGDVRSALNAYTAALDADTSAGSGAGHGPQSLACLANRSVCHLRLAQAAECKADCTAALQLIASTTETDPSSGNGQGAMAVKLLMRRGTASCQLGQFTEALTDYHQARVKLEQLPAAQVGSLAGISAETLASDIVRLKLLSDAEQLKKEADALMADRDLTAALFKYTQALELIPVHVGCLSNRSACRLALKDPSGCIADCTAAISLLTYDTTASAPLSALLQPAQARTMLANVLPAAGSAKRASWLVKTLLRRAVAQSQLGALDLAVEDYARASALEPANEALKADLSQLIAARDQVAAAKAEPTPVQSSSSEVTQ